MAFEVFDDVAFYWFFFSIVVMIILPWTYIRVISFIYPSTKGKRNKSYFSWSNIMFLLTWLTFIYMLIQISYFSEQKMATFDPYEILKIEKGAEYSEIKKAYRTLSLQYHPDKSSGLSAEEKATAEAAFILVSKAHLVLTDEATRENWEKYGNPDGYKGTSVTIGLPSYLTNGANELVILVVYFIIFFIIIPIIVFSIATRAQRFHDSGLLHNTIAVFVGFVEENWSTKFLIQTFSAAEEFQVFSQIKDPENFGKVVKDIERLDLTAKVKKDKPGNFYALTLIYAHLLRLDVSEELQEDLKFILTSSTKLLDVMFDIQLSRGFNLPAQGAIELMQLLSQGMWLHGSQFLQLPFVTEDTLKPLARKNIKSLRQLASMTAAARKDLFLSADVWPTLDKRSVQNLKDGSSSALSDAELEVQIIFNELEKAVRALPFVDCSFNYQIPGEDRPDEKKKVRATDILQLNLVLDRLRPEELEKKKAIKSESTEAAESSEPEPKLRNSICDRFLNFMSPNAVNDPNSLDSIIISKEDSEISTVRNAVCPRFPGDKPERWIVILFNTTNPSDPKTMNNQKFVFEDGSMQATCKFMIPFQDAGTYSFEAHVYCDSYVDLDPEPISIKITVEPNFSEEEILEQKKKQRAFLLHPELAKKEKKTKKEKIVVVEDEDKEEEDSDEEIDFDPQYETPADKFADEEAPIHWYYLWNSTFTEFVLSLILLALLGVVIFDILHSRGIWQESVQPVIDRLWSRIEPLLPTEDNFFTSALRNVYSFVANIAATETDSLMTAK